MRLFGGPDGFTNTSLICGHFECSLFLRAKCWGRIMYFIERLRSTGFALLVLCCIAPTASADKREDFQSAYKAYQQHMQANDITLATDAAEQAYRLGSKVYGRNSVNTARLAINYAILLNDARESKRAQKVLKGKLRVLEKEFGKTTTELVPVLMELGRANFELERPRNGLMYFDRVTAVVEDNDDALYRGEKNFDIVSFMLKRGAHATTKKFVEAAYTAYSESLTPDDIRLGLVAYHMALWSTRERQFDDAVTYLNGALSAFETIGGDMGNLERTVRVMSVRILEQTGQSNLATPHLLALGESQAWVSPVRPLYIPAPKLDSIYELAGDVTLAFTVDERGFVMRPDVAQSSEPGLNSTALEVIGRSRFAPRFENGEAVATDDVRYTMSFDGVRERYEVSGTVVVEDPLPPLRDFPTRSVHDAQRDEVLYPGLDADKERDSTGNVYF